MEFGRINDSQRLDKIKWSLPSLQSEEETAQLQRLERASRRINTPASFRIGIPVWSEPEWVGKLFPAGTRTENFLREYARQFPVVEVNSTFYAVPPVTTFQKWMESVPENFRFCPKFPQSFSRSIAHKPVLEEFDVFLGRIGLFGEKLGCTFLQLPPDVEISSLGRLQEVLSKIPREAKAMVEFRHESFFVNRRLKPEALEMLAHNHLGTVITDTAMYRDLVHASLSSTRVLLRFAASNGHPSDYPRVDQWVERLSHWIRHGLKEAFITIHAMEPLPEIEVARYFIQKLNTELAVQEIPLSQNEPEFYHEQQGSLF